MLSAVCTIQHRQSFLQTSTVLYQLLLNSSLLIHLYLKNESYILFTLVSFPEGWGFWGKPFKQNKQNNSFLPFFNSSFLTVSMNTSSQVCFALQTYTDSHIYSFPNSGAGSHLVCLIFSTTNTLENPSHVHCTQQVCDAELEEQPQPTEVPLLRPKKFSSAFMEIKTV